MQEQINQFFHRLAGEDQVAEHSQEGIGGLEQMGQGLTCEIQIKNNIRDGGTTTLYTAYTVDTVYIVYTVYTIQTDFTVACVPIYIVRDGQNAIGMG